MFVCLVTGICCARTRLHARNTFSFIKSAVRAIDNIWFIVDSKVKASSSLCCRGGCRRWLTHQLDVSIVHKNYSLPSLVHTAKNSLPPHGFNGPYMVDGCVYILAMLNLFVIQISPKFKSISWKTFNSMKNASRPWNAIRTCVEIRPSIHLLSYAKFFQRSNYWIIPMTHLSRYQPYVTVIHCNDKMICNNHSMQQQICVYHFHRNSWL